MEIVHISHHNPPSDEAAYDLVVQVAAGALDDVPENASVLESGSAQRRTGARRRT